MRKLLVLRSIGFCAVVLAMVLHSLPTAAQVSGSIYRWGTNGHGELGMGTSDDDPHPLPIRMIGSTDVVALSAGDGHTLVLTRYGTVYAWGRNFNGEIGNGSTGISVPTPVQVGGLSNVIAVSAGGGHSLALTSGGTVYSWGRNLYGQLGDSTNADRWTPTPVPGLTNVIAISAGGNHSLALRSIGTVYAWGRNLYGQVGDGSYTDRSSPVLIATSNIRNISAGYEHSIARRSDGATFAWGNNDSGQLGDLTTTKRNTPTPIFGTFASVAAGAYHTLGIVSNGLGANSVQSWGSNTFGQLGQGTTDNNAHPTPSAVDMLHGIAMVSGGWDHSLVLLQDGTAYGFGRNSSGHLGNGTTDNTDTPIQVAGLTGATYISAGGIFSAAIRRSDLLATVSTNASAYTTSDQLKLLVSLSNPGAQTAVDLYLVLIPPDGSYLFLRYDMTNGSVSIHPGSQNPSTWTPLVTSSPLSADFGLASFVLFTHTFSGGEAPGTYTWYIAATTPGTTQFIGPVGSAAFTFTP